MSDENKKLANIGNVLSSLGGLLVILNFTTFKDSEWQLELAILAVVMAFAGLVILSKAKKTKVE